VPPPPRLDRFKRAQKSSEAGFESALYELQTGAKRGHWIWYIFPQLSGLGSSGPSMFFAIADEKEAIEFLRDTELRNRLHAAASAVAEQLERGTGLVRLMGSQTDARKLVSSLTLFGDVAKRLDQLEPDTALASLSRIAANVLSAAAAEGYDACQYTLEQLRLGRARSSANVKQ
jgi:uncharacterized protein (DUF1810 family)